MTTEKGKRSPIIQEGEKRFTNIQAKEGALPTGEVQESLLSFTRVKTNGFSFLISNQFLIEIFTTSALETLPNVPKVVLGSINFRGEVIVVLNLTEVLSIKTSSQINIARGDSVRLLIIDFEGERYGLYVDQIDSIVKIEKEKILQAYTLRDFVLVEGLYRGVILDEDQNPSLILNVSELINNYSLTAGNVIENEIVHFVVAEEAIQSEIDAVFLSDQKGHMYFRINDDFFAIKISNIYDIISSINLVEAPNTPSYFLGTISQRDQVIPVIDLRSFFYGSSPSQFKSRDSDIFQRELFIVISFNNEKIVVRIEAIEGIISSAEEIPLYSYHETNELVYFKEAFLYQNELVASINLESLFSGIRGALFDVKKDFVTNNKSLTIDPDPESYDIINHNIQLIKEQKSLIPTTIRQVKSHAITTELTEEPYISGVTIHVDTTQIFIPDSQIEEIYNEITINTVPTNNPALLGALNYRGTVISVIDIHEIIFPSNKIRSHKKSQTNIITDHIIVIAVKGQRIALAFKHLKEWVKIEKSIIRAVSSSELFDHGNYLFTGSFIDKNDDIVFLLDSSWIINNYQDKDKILASFQKSVFFTNLETEELEHDIIEDFEGLLVKCGTELFILDTSLISTIIGKKEGSYILHSFNNKAIVGLGIHNEIHPIIDFHYFIHENQQEQINNSSIRDNSAIITIQDPITGKEIGLLVEEIIAKVSPLDLEVFQKDNFLKRNVCDDLYQGFFAHSSLLGGLLHPKTLLKKLQDIIFNEFNKSPSENDFEALIKAEEKDKLIEFREKQREIEFMLFDDSGKERVDCLVFTIDEICFSIIIDSSISISVAEYKNVNKIPHHPLLGILSHEERNIPVVDAVNIMFPANDFEDRGDSNLFLLVEGDTLEYAIPIKNIIGVLSAYVENLIPIKSNDTFIDEYNLCKFSFVSEESKTPIFVLEKSFINHVAGNTELIKQIDTNT